MENADDPKLADWAVKQDRIARKTFKQTSTKFYRRMSRYYRLPLVRSIQNTAEGLTFFYSDEKSYKIDLLKGDGSRKTVVDSAKLAKDAVIQAVQARRSGGQLAVHYSVGGSDEGSVLIMDLKSRKTVDELQGFIAQIAWLEDGSYYYVRTYRNQKSPDGVSPPTSRVFLRKGEKEEMVFGSGLPTNTFIGISASSEGSKALLDVSHGWVSRPYAGDLTRPETWRPIHADADAVIQNVDYVDGRYYLQSFEKGNGEVLSTDGIGSHVVVHEGPWPLQDTDLVGGKILCHYLVDASSELHLYDNTGKLENTLKFDLPGSLIGSPAMSVFGGEAVFAFSSFTVPYRVYRLRGGTLDTVLSEELALDCPVKHRHATSRDGTNVHFFTVAKRGAPPKKVLLFGYGGFRISLTPSFDPSIMPFLEDGGTFAVANLRGGLERGEEWHRAGMREKKPAVFEDYLAVADKLHGEGARVVGYGRSNGGLLLGAAMNSRPDLFAGVVIGYPVLDMMAFHRLFVGKAWVPEYGDPEVQADAEFLLKYSPYQNLKPKARLPPVFIYTGLRDDRVHPAHAFKFYSRLKEGPNKAFLRVETESGHIGTTPEARIREESDKMAFVYKMLGLRK